MLCLLPSPPAPLTLMECGTGRIFPEHPLPPRLWQSSGVGQSQAQIPPNSQQPSPLLLLDGDRFRLMGRRSFYQEKLLLLEQLCSPPPLPTEGPQTQSGGANISFQAPAFFLNF